MVFSEQQLNKVQEVINRYPEGKQKSAILPLLHMAQQQGGGWLDVSSMDYVATLLNIKPIEVYEVATILFNVTIQRPVGKYVFEVCQTGPCMLNGSDDIIKYIENKLSDKKG